MRMPTLKIPSWLCCTMLLVGLTGCSNQSGGTGSSGSSGSPSNGSGGRSGSAVSSHSEASSGGTSVSSGGRSASNGGVIASGGKSSDSNDSGGVVAGSGGGSGKGGSTIGTGGGGSGGARSATGGKSSGGGSASTGTGGASSGAGGTTASSGASTGGSSSSTTTAFSVLTDTNRDGVVDDKDSAGFTDWSWKGVGAFFVANVDDDDKKGKADASDQIVNGSDDEADLARIIIKIPSDLASKAASVSVSVTTGSAQTHLFEKASSGWKLVNGALGQVAAQSELGLEAMRFADADWDGLATVKVDLLDSGKTSLASQQVKLRVAPWIMLPNSAKTELLYISSSTSRLRPDINKVLQSAGLPDAATSNPGGQDIWFQDTMEIGYTQLPGKSPMHVVMKAQRPNASDNVAITLLAPNFGYISIGTPRQPPSEEDHWMDWTGNLEVSHPVPAYPLGRIYYGKSPRTTFQPTIVKFLEAQQVQKPFALNTEWLMIQHVDEIVSFLPDKDGKAKMLIVSPAAANAVMGSGYDAGNQQIQKYIEEDITLFKTELGLTDNDIIQIPTFVSGSGTNYVPIWSNPVNSVYVNGTFMMGKNKTPAAIKTDIEKKLGAIGVQAAWVDDSEYDVGGGNVHCATNTKKTPLCANFTGCLMPGLTP